MSLFANKPTGLDALLHRPRPSAWQQFLGQPYNFLSRKLYTWQRIVPAGPLTDQVSIVCISDTHNSQPALPTGDILIHAGDLTQSGSFKELEEALAWLRAQPHSAKIVIAGNHDLLLDPGWDDPAGRAADERRRLDWGDIVYLEDAETTIICHNGRRIRVYGSPRSARHGNWAFQYPRSEDVWAGKVPDGVDVLVTHGPPRGHLDLMSLGCVHLLWELWRVRPRLHVFGHAHEGAGTEWLRFDGLQAAYEQAVIDGGLWNVARTAFELLRALLHPATEAKCLLVNPSIVGGLQDDERRKAIRVVI